jgi:hypothetical protein
MTFEEILDQAIAMLQRRGRLTYRTLKLQFQLDDEHLEALKDELLYGQRLAVDEDDRVLVWTGDTDTAPPAAAAHAEIPARTPLAYTPICARISHNSCANTSLGSNWLPFLSVFTAAIERGDRLWGQLL